jgi:hypothetical protein
MNDRMRLMLSYEPQQTVIVASHVYILEGNRSAADFTPSCQARLQGLNRRQRHDAQFVINATPRQIVEDKNVVPPLGQMQRRWPTRETIAAQDHNLHRCRPLLVR